MTMNRMHQAADSAANIDRLKGIEDSATTNALYVAATMFEAIMRRADEQATDIEYLKKRVEVLEARRDVFMQEAPARVIALEKKVAALEAAQQRQPAPVASWLEQAVNLLAQFASAKQHDWAGVEPVHLPEGVLPWRELEDGLTDLADEIAAATATAQQPAPAPVETVAETNAQILQMDGMDSNVLLSINADVWRTLNRLRADQYGYPVRVVFYPADTPAPTGPAQPEPVPTSDQAKAGTGETVTIDRTVLDEPLRILAEVAKGTPVEWRRAGAASDALRSALISADDNSPGVRPYRVSAWAFEAALEKLTDIAERGTDWQADQAREVLHLLTGIPPRLQSAGPFPVKSDEVQS